MLQRAWVCAWWPYIAGTGYIAVSCFDNPCLSNGQTKRIVTRFCVVRIPGWERPCNKLNILYRRDFGAYGHTVSQAISQYISTTWSGNRISFSWNARVAELTIPRNSVSFSCAAVKVRWSTDFSIASIRDEVLPTLLSTFIYRISVVNWPIQATETRDYV
jgi:hypothetical protein